MDNNKIDDTLIEFSPVTEITDNEEIVDISSLTVPEENEKVIDINNIINNNPVENSNEQSVPIPEVPNNEVNNINQVNNNNLFETEYNKKTQEQHILNMNPELKVNVKEEKKYSKLLALLPIFTFVSTLILGIYVFTNNTKADTANLIRIEEKNKVGYINNNGEVIINPKYVYGSDYYKGLAIVKNYNNLLGVINNKDSFTSPFGNFFSIERFSNRYIVSKFTSNGLKQALLNSSLEELTRYKYDTITYAKDNTFIFVRENTMGLLNSYGKEIYKYESNDVDDKNITIEVSKIDGRQPKYAKVKVNDSATIININSGKEVYKYTLDDIFVQDNNVFYIKSKYEEENNRYIVIKNDKVAFESYDYVRLRVDDYDSNIAIGVKNDLENDYIDINKKTKINEMGSYDYIYGDGIILKKDFDFSENAEVFDIIKNGKVKETVRNIKPVSGEFKNGLLKVYVADNKYNYITENGKYINDEQYDTATNFNEFGYAIVSINKQYGIIDKTGKNIINLKYEDIDFINNDLFKTLKDNYKKELFIYKNGEKKGIISKEDDIILKAGYDDFEYITTKYPFIKGINDLEIKLINLDINKVYNIELYEEPVIFNSYFIIGSKYYNYNGDKIYDTNGEIDDEKR